ncbi:3334_t:CDS:2 [Paraglomus brasilianum]|uniref:3334_t:CDS:1 n=1 Tax=Paraglomus brasilianum TaxID=144538 RepID=A0A9N9F160_9GLOM|nr:3334_t:CDS:2 [Paraglomus brasilianum]
MNPLFPTQNPLPTSAAATAFAMDPYSWDLTSLEDNIEAQKLLAAAIASNDRYRYEEDAKRKLDLLEDFIQQTPTKASHNLNVSSVPHPDLSTQDPGELSNSPTLSEHSSEPQKKKPGRKPLTNTPSSKRKAQNRAAQRAFRERKERYVKELENKIKALESQSAKSVQENEKLKALVEQLREENSLLKQSNFSFDFTVSSASRSTADIDKKISDFVGQPPRVSTTVGQPDVCTPPSSQNSDEEASTPASSVGQAGNLQPIEAGTPFSNFSNSPQISTYDFVIVDDDMSASEVAPLPKPTKQSSAKPQSAKEFCQKFTNGVCPDDLDDDNETSDSHKRSSSGAFTQYRDPTPFTVSIDAPFSNAEPLGPLFEENFEEFGSYAPMADSATPTSDIRDALFTALSNHGNGFASLEDIRDKKYLSCNKVWERIQQHPKFDDLEDDEMDQLCNELKAKARCSGHGPVVAEEEVDAALVKLSD